MAGMYSQSRDLSVVLRCRQQRVAAGTRPTAPWTDQTIPGKQVTTSFRSGQVADRLEAETPDANIWRRSQGGQESVADTGHEFYSRKDRFVSTDFTFNNWRYAGNSAPGYEMAMDGPLLISDPIEVSKHCYPRVTALAQDGGATLGSAMIKRAAPTRPTSGTAQAIAELLSEGLVVPNLDFRPSWRAVDRSPRELGDAHLAIEFGIKPLYRDVVSFINALKGANATIRAFERDSGRFVRRRRSLPTVTRYDEVITAPPYSNYGPAVSNLGWAGPGAITYTSEVTTDVWFSGAFTYFVPVPDGAMAKLERYEALANKVLGVRVQPDTLWELTPWSWLVDWFVNVGDILSNAVTFSNDGLVMKYGYLMRRTRIRTVASTAFLLPAGSSGNRPNLVVKNYYETDVKERMRATPFGFGLTEASFSARQWAILAALGLSRAPSSLYN